MLGPSAAIHRVEEVLQSLRDFEEEQFSKQPERVKDSFASTSFLGVKHPRRTPDRCLGRSAGCSGCMAESEAGTPR